MLLGLFCSYISNKKMLALCLELLISDMIILQHKFHLIKLKHSSNNPEKNESRTRLTLLSYYKQTTHLFDSYFTKMASNPTPIIWEPKIVLTKGHGTFLHETMEHHK